MESIIRRAFLFCFVAAISMAFVGCSGKDSAASGGPASGSQSAAPGGSDAGAPLYPDWAQAVVPPYPSASLGLLVNQNLYQFQTDDDLAKVVAWYKSKVSGNWETDASSGSQAITIGAVKITIVTMTSKDSNPGKTSININHD